jgi:hypothetical protein
MHPNLRVNRVLWQAEQRVLKCQKRILEFREVLSTLIEVEKLERMDEPSEPSESTTVCITICLHNNLTLND